MSDSSGIAPRARALYDNEAPDPLTELADALECLDLTDRAEFFQRLIGLVQQMPSYDPMRRLQAQVEANWERRGHIGPSVGELRPTPAVTFTVYYIRFRDRVKIGYTSALVQRLQAIPYDEVLATEPGGLDVERQRHQQFAALREQGEWFRYEGALAGHIESLQPA